MAHGPRTHSIQFSDQDVAWVDELRNRFTNDEDSAPNRNEVIRYTITNVLADVRREDGAAASPATIAASNAAQVIEERHVGTPVVIKAGLEVSDRKQRRTTVKDHPEGQDNDR